MNRDDVLRLALATMERIAVLVPRDDPQVGDAINALRTALAEAEAEDAKIRLVYTCILCGTSDKPCKHGSRNVTAGDAKELCGSVRVEAEEPVMARLTIAEAHEIFAKSLNAAHSPPCLPRREPLTDEQINVVTAAARDALMDHVYEHGTVAEGQQRFIRQIARAVERAHGIGGDE